MISLFTKVMSLQSRLILEKKCDSKCFDTTNIFLGIEIIFSMTAVLILIISLIIFPSGILKLKILAKKLMFSGLPIKSIWCKRPTELPITVKLQTFNSNNIRLYD